jgi:tryptophan halogenase
VSTDNKKFKFVIIGGGTAGIIAASYIRTYWGDQIDVCLIYDHKNPGIGVGESLTPIIYQYLDYLNITKQELIKNVNATVKLGLLFKNWLNDEKSYIHSFYEINDGNDYSRSEAFDIINGMYDQGPTYGKYYFDNCCIPLNNSGTESLHIDATLFSKFIENKFRDKIDIIDDIVLDIIKSEKNSNIIDSLVLKNNGKFIGDFFIDASGFQSILFKKLENQWVDKTDWLPLDRCIPNPVEQDFKNLPPYTIAEATDQGWILQVPLSNRWGTGYLYSSEFLSDDLAFVNFQKFIKNKFDKTLSNKDKILKFKSGFWNKQWVGNCIAIGLSSGFSEPLEATNIHHTILQTTIFTEIFNFKLFDHDTHIYNNLMKEFYNNIYLYIRFCYSTDRIDSNFWKYMTNNIPKEVKDLETKIKFNIPTNNFFSNNKIFFTQANFLKIAYGLGKINIQSYQDNLLKRNILEKSKIESCQLAEKKKLAIQHLIDHKRYIDFIKSSGN